MATATADKKRDELQEQHSKLESLRKEFVKNAKARLAELDREREELNKSLTSVTGENGASAPASTPAPARGRPRRGGRKGKRADQFVKMVRENPGIQVSEIAKRMNIKPNYLYRIAADAVERGEVTRDGRGYKVAA